MIEITHKNFILKELVAEKKRNLEKYRSIFIHFIPMYNDNVGLVSKLNLKINLVERTGETYFEVPYLNRS